MSTQSKRGVAILIKKSTGVSILETIADREENYLLAKIITAEGKTIVVGAVYGPNTADRQFFVNLTRDIRTLGDYPRIVGGDWNVVPSSEPIQVNIDCYQMNAVPNAG